MLPNQTRWKTPEYSKKQINKAGAILRNRLATPEDRAAALRIVDNWRASHAYPLHAFYMNLRRSAAGREDILVAERLKRLESIEAKLQRQSDMQLYRMHDLGGCRMVLPSIADVYEFSQKFASSRIRHKLHRVDDYIKSPKESGYRSLHLVYKFKSDKPNKKVFNDYPMWIELQFRTHLQHIWATALETIGLFTNQALKAGSGNKDILRFFVVISSLFAIREGCPICPGTLPDEQELISEIEMLNDENHILDMLKAIRTVIEHDADKVPDRRGYYLLQLDYKSHQLTRWFYKPSDLAAANGHYDWLEAHRGDRPLDIVLVRAASYATVKAAYPNYFLDIGEFIDLVEAYLK